LTQLTFIQITDVMSGLTGLPPRSALAIVVA